MAKSIKVENGSLQVNSYICYFKGGDCFIVDPSDGAKEIISKVEHFNLKPRFIVLTHGHCDHISGVKMISEQYNIPVYAHELEKVLIENASYNLSEIVYQSKIELKDVIYLKDGEHEIDGLTFELISTPGHTKGSACIYLKEDDFIYTGDLLFKNSIGRTDLPTGNQNVLFESLKKFSKFSRRMTIFPGHGPRTTLRDEMNNNPYLKV